MSYFPVDDQFAFHPKALAAGNAALGLWVRAGAWSKQHTTGGFVPEEVALSIAPKVSASRLVAAGLWDRVDGGYQFHDWESQAGNRSADQEKKAKEANAERQRRHRRKGKEGDEGNALRNGESNAVTDGAVTAPPVPVPLLTSDTSSYVPERESYPQDDEKLRQSIQNHPAGRAPAYDELKVRRELAVRTNRIVSSEAMLRIIGEIITGRDLRQIRNLTGYLVQAIENEPFRFQKILDEFGALGADTAEATL